MILTPSDIERIKKLGFNESDFMIKSDDGFYRLRNIDSYCYFYDNKQRVCKIYEQRPLGCRIYPIIYIYEENIVTVDSYCPASDTVTFNDIVKALPLMIRILKELRIDIDFDNIKIVL